MTETDSPVSKLWGMIKDIKIAMLVTTGPDGQLSSRPMSTQQVEFDGDLWFFTAKSSGKSHAIEDRPEVNVSYSSNGGRFVSVSGRAEFVDDKQKFKELWNPAYKVFFPLGLEDPDLVLLKIGVHSAEYWDSPSGPMKAINFARAFFTKDPGKLGENKRLNIGH